ncbi:MAG: ArnT family glycosyltransferase [Patescibacteria group bacterium]
MKKKLFYLVILLAVFLRVFKLGVVPIELNRDEASLGYTAYSILLTGREEHGQAWPIQIESFGDWKLPLYVYSLMPFIAVFGLETWVVRLPSMLAGIGLVITSYYLVQRLFSKSKNRENLALGTAFLLAVSPWQIHFSHVAYEAHLSLLFFILGLLGLLKVKNIFETNKQIKIGLLVVAVFSLAITLLGYHAYQVFTPLFLLGFIYFEHKFVKKFFKGINRKKIFLVCFPLLLVLTTLVLSGVTGANKTKFSGLSIFSPNAYSTHVSTLRLMLEQPNHPFLVVVLNKFVAIFDQIVKNFFALVSPEFLFVKGGDNGAHNITGFGNFYPLMFLGLVVGITQIFIGSMFGLNLLGMWLLTAAVAPMITFTANHTVRFSPAFIAIEILSVYGWSVIISFLKEKLSRKLFLIVLWALTIGLFYFIYKFLISYYFIFPKQDAGRWSWQMKPLVFQVDALKNNYDKIIIQDEQSSPYIYFLFHLKIDPNSLVTRIEYYPPDSEGFRHVKRLDNIYFEKIDWEVAHFLYEDRLFVIGSEEIPDYNKTHERFTLLNQLKQDQLDKQIEFWQYERFR